MSKLAKKYHPAFHEAQRLVGKCFGDTNTYAKCLAQFENKNDAMEVFALYRIADGTPAGIVSVRYVFGNHVGPASVFFFYDEGTLAKTAKHAHPDTWGKSATLIQDTMHTEAG